MVNKIKGIFLNPEIYNTIQQTIIHINIPLVRDVKESMLQLNSLS